MDLGLREGLVKIAQNMDMFGSVTEDVAFRRNGEYRKNMIERHSNKTHTSLIVYVINLKTPDQYPVYQHQVAARLKLLREIHNLLISVIPGLVYDQVATVNLVLSTLRTQLLENTHITKTRKMNVFNTALVHNLLALYDWIGPDGHWSAVKNKLKKNSLGNEDDKQLVGLALHHLLLVLCTSHKHGVIFHDKSIGTSGKKYNELIETVLEFMNQPWEDELRRELTLKILVACPDLFTNFVTRIKPYLTPRNSISWFKTINFLKEVISSMDAKTYLKSQDSNFSKDQLTTMIKNLAVPSTVLHMARKAILTEYDMDVGYQLIELLSTMFNGLHSFMSSVEQAQLLSQRDLEEMKATIQTYLMENSPTGEALLLAWKKATSHPKAKILVPMQQSHPLTLLDLLSLLHQCCPQLIDTDTFDSRTFLSDVQRVFSGEEDEAKHIIKALQLLVAIDKLTFAPGKKMFEPTLSLLLSLLGSSSCTPAHTTLCSLLWETGLFEGSEVEMLVWLHCYMAISQEHRAEVARILVQAVTHVAIHPGRYLDMVAKATELAKEDDWTSRLDVDDIFDELMEVENITRESHDYQPTSSAVTLGPLLPGFLQVATEHLGDNEPSPELANFSSYVVVHLLHSQISSSTLYNIVAEFSMLLPSSVLTYVQGWHKFISLITVWFKGYSKNKREYHGTEDLLRLVDLLQLDIKDIVSLLERMAPIPTDLLVSSPGDSNSISTSVSPLGSLLSHLLSRAGILHQLSLKKVGVILQNTVERLIEHLIVLEKRNDVDVTLLERGLLEFLESFPHHLAYVSKELLRALLKHPKPQVSTIKLATFLVERNKQFISVFESQASKITSVVETPELLFPVLSAALAHGSDIVNEDFLKSVYNYYMTNIHEAVIQITKAPDWLKQNPAAIIWLVDRFMESDTSKRLYDHLQTKQSSRTYDDLYVLLLKKIFDKVKSQNIALVESPRVLQTEIFLDMLLKLCKQKSQDMKQVTDLAAAICECVDSAEETNTSWKTLKKSITWSEFTKLALKLGLAKKGQFMLLDVMSKLCEVLYRDGCREEQVVTLFQMVLSHSQFFNVVIGSAPNKYSVIQLLLVLVKKAPSVMTSAHVPVLLGAYNASLSTSDQLILRLLKSYEHSGVSLHECRPYLWGEAAVNHYSVRSALAQSLWRQPNIEQVLNLLTVDNVATTLKYFPLNRTLKVGEKLHADAPNTYDPAFLLPLFSHLLAPENLSRTFRFHRSGALALTLACLGSNCESVRQAAFHVVARFYFHLEASTGSDKKVWVQFINALGGGICQISEDVQSVQPPYIVALFLARASLHVSNPLHPMFAPLHNYISLKSALNLTTVPEFLALFHSSDVNYRVHRHFILEVLRDGMKQKDDFEISHKNVIYKILLSFYSSVIADKKSKLLILEIVESSVKIPEAAPLLVSSYGILSWLEQIIQQLKPGDEHVKTILHILASLWNTLVNSPSSSKDNCLSDVSHHTLLLLLDLFTKFKVKMSPKELDIYLATVYKVLSLQNCGKVLDAMTFTHMTSILHFSKEILGSIEDCEDLLHFGYQFYKISSEDVKEKDDFVLARYNLRRLTVEWLNKTRKSD
uniref:Nucleolar pre-ribosomal-associated protein 1 n=1 Tax=Timema shepardi TaxID=629360 RepID=A0A7R9AV52_TIMSH|nr:unnamed protein product [Timema shepardi]